MNLIDNIEKHPKILFIVLIKDLWETVISIYNYLNSEIMTDTILNLDINYLDIVFDLIIVYFLYGLLCKYNENKERGKVNEFILNKQKDKWDDLMKELFLEDVMVDLKKLHLTKLEIEIIEKFSEDEQRRIYNYFGIKKNIKQ